MKPGTRIHYPTLALNAGVGFYTDRTGVTVETPTDDLDPSRYVRVKWDDQKEPVWIARCAIAARGVTQPEYAGKHWDASVATKRPPPRSRMIGTHRVG